MVILGTLLLQLSHGCMLNGVLERALVQLYREQPLEVVDYLALGHRIAGEDVWIKAKAMEAYLKYPDLPLHERAARVDVSEKIPVLLTMGRELKKNEARVRQLLVDLRAHLQSPRVATSESETKAMSDLIARGEGFLRRIVEVQEEIAEVSRSRKLNLVRLTEFADDYAQLAQSPTFQAAAAHLGHDYNGGNLIYQKFDATKEFDLFPFKISLPTFEKGSKDLLEEGALSGVDYQGLALMDESYSFDGRGGFGWQVSRAYSFHDRTPVEGMSDLQDGHFRQGLTPRLSGEGDRGRVRNYVRSLRALKGFWGQMDQVAGHLEFYPTFRFEGLHESEMGLSPLNVHSLFEETSAYELWNTYDNLTYPRRLTDAERDEGLRTLEVETKEFLHLVGEELYGTP